MTLGDCYTKIMGILDGYGSVLPGEEEQLYPRAAAHLDTCLRELAARRPLMREMRFFQTRLKTAAKLDLCLKGTEDLIIPADSAKAACFCTNAAMTAKAEHYVNGSWVTLATLTAAASDEAQEYRMVFTPAAGAPVRLRFTGGCGMVSHIGLYDESFAGADEVPMAEEYRWHPLPERFFRTVKLVLYSFVSGKIGECRNYRLKDGKIGLPWDFEGEAKLLYAAYAPRITADAAPDTQLEVDDGAADAAAYYTAACLMGADDTAAYNHLMLLFEARLCHLDLPTVNRAVGNRLFGLVGTADVCRRKGGRRGIPS